MEEVLNGDIWQTWRFISEEDRGNQIEVFRSNMLFRDYRSGHCLNDEKFRMEDKMVVFDSYTEQLIELCCKQWTGEEAEEPGQEVFGKEVLTQEMAEDICRNYRLIDQV